MQVYPYNSAYELARANQVFFNVSNPSDKPMKVQLMEGLPDRRLVCQDKLRRESEIWHGPHLVKLCGEDHNMLEGCNQSTFVFPESAADTMVIPPGATVSAGPIYFMPKHKGWYCGEFFLRNNLTGVTPVMMYGEGASAELAFKTKAGKEIAPGFLFKIDGLDKVIALGEDKMKRSIRVVGDRYPDIKVFDGWKALTGSTTKVPIYQRPVRA